jgi:hypothetical protein
MTVRKGSIFPHKKERERGQFAPIIYPTEVARNLYYRLQSIKLKASVSMELLQA